MSFSGILPTVPTPHLNRLPLLEKLLLLPTVEADCMVGSSPAPAAVLRMLPDTLSKRGERQGGKAEKGLRGIGLNGAPEIKQTRKNKAQKQRPGVPKKAVTGEELAPSFLWMFCKNSV